MKYLHTMVRVLDLQTSLKFYCDGLGLEVIKQKDYPAGKFTLVYLAPKGQPDAQLELTHNWEQQEDYSHGRNFGHVAYEVEHIYQTCEHLQNMGITILRPPRDGHMAFIRSPDGISIELLQQGEALTPCEPWLSMPNSG